MRLPLSSPLHIADPPCSITSPLSLGSFTRHVYPLPLVPILVCNSISNPFSPLHNPVARTCGLWHVALLHSIGCSATARSPVPRVAKQKGWWTSHRNICSLDCISAAAATATIQARSLPCPAACLSSGVAALTRDMNKWSGAMFERG